MKKINLYILLFGISFIFILCSCEKEDDLKISEKKTQRFDLPQGNHDFDEQIVEWYNDYETAVLYKFSNADINYHFTSSSNDVNYDVKVEADEEGIRAAVKFLKEDFFDLYSDKVLLKSSWLVCFTKTAIMFPYGIQSVMVILVFAKGFSYEELIISRYLTWIKNLENE